MTNSGTGRRLAVVAVTALTAIACSTTNPRTAEPVDPGPPPPAGIGGAVTIAPSAAAARLRVEVVGEHPHDPTAFTQGLEVLDGGLVLESTGRVGTSSLRLTELATGRMVRRVDVPELFAMGATMVPDVGIWQVTWRDGVAILRDPTTLAEQRRVSYAGEGWGVCFDGARLVMSDGTDRLTFRDPRTFDRLGEVRVTHPSITTRQLNELDCQTGVVWANVWHKHHILRIDLGSGAVTAVVDIGRIVEIENTTAGLDAVPNGIAALPGTDEFLLAGKLYRTTYQVRLTPTGA